MRIIPNAPHAARRVPVPLRAAVAAGLGAAVLHTAACSSSGAAAQSSPSAAPSGGGAGQTSRRFDGTSGLIAEIDGKTLQVQGAEEQTAVTYTSSTTFTTQVADKASDIRAGECVSVRSASDGASASPEATGSTSVTATSVTVAEASGGSCQGAVGGFDRDRGRSFGTRPSGAPSAGTASGRRPGAFPSGARSFGRMVSGKVTKVSGDTLTVAVVRPTGGGRSTGASPSSGATAGSATTTATTVTLTATTSVTRTETTNFSALKVGLCALAQGRTDSTGAVTAKSIRLSAATHGSCTMEG